MFLHILFVFTYTVFFLGVVCVGGRGLAGRGRGRGRWGVTMTVVGGEGPTVGRWGGAGGGGGGAAARPRAGRAALGLLRLQINKFARLCT